MRRRHLLHAIPILVAIGIVVAGRAHARLGETFVLEDKDQLLVEAPGCHASCGIQSPVRRECSVREPECHVVCQMIPECKPNGLRPIQVCAVVKER
jgi:hypothetical protein